MKLRIHAVLPSSEANGPGRRFTAWFSGCTLKCQGCINPGTHATVSHRTKFLSPEELAAEIPPDVEGVSLSGGEPFQQDTLALSALLERVSWQGEGRHTALIFTGYTSPELEEMGRRDLYVAKALSFVDILVSGRYVPAQRVKDRPLLGSSNQQILFLSRRYSEADLARVAPVETHFDLNDGSTVTTGFPGGLPSYGTRNEKNKEAPDEG